MRNRMMGGRQNFGKIFLNTKYTKVTKGEGYKIVKHPSLVYFVTFVFDAFQKTDAHTQMIILPTNLTESRTTRLTQIHPPALANHWTQPHFAR